MIHSLKKGSLQIIQIKTVSTLALLQLSHTHLLRASYFTSGNVSLVGRRVALVAQDLASKPGFYLIHPWVCLISAPLSSSAKWGELLFFLLQRLAVGSCVGAGEDVRE